MQDLLDLMDNEAQNLSHHLQRQQRPLEVNHCLVSTIKTQLTPSNLQVLAWRMITLKWRESRRTGNRRINSQGFTYDILSKIPNKGILSSDKT
jgi:hypothetical protein